MSCFYECIHCLIFINKWFIFIDFQGSLHFNLTFINIIIIIITIIIIIIN